MSALIALKHRDFRLIWLGQLVSLAGTQMQQVAINWHVYILTKSPVALGLIGLMRVGPIIVFSLILGLLLPRLGAQAGAVLYLVLFGGYTGIVHYLFVARGIWFSWVYPA